MAKFLEISTNDDVIKEVKIETNVEKMKETTLAPGLEMFVRKGISGDWKNHFSKEQEEKFDKWVEEKKKEYPEELFKLINEWI